MRRARLHVFRVGVLVDDKASGRAAGSRNGSRQPGLGECAHVLARSCACDRVAFVAEIGELGLELFHLTDDVTVTRASSSSFCDALRHRRCSLWLAHGFETVFVKQWTGDSKASMLSDVYGHVLVEPDGNEWRQFWLEAYDAQRRRGPSSAFLVWPR
jgi:hypothetical protein